MKKKNKTPKGHEKMPEMSDEEMKSVSGGVESVPIKDIKDLSAHVQTMADAGLPATDIAKHVANFAAYQERLRAG